MSKKHPEFSNLMVCIYKDDENGRKLANGQNVLLNNYDQSRSWIAMYTFNPVEGVFFNDNPSGFRENN